MADDSSTFSEPGMFSARCTFVRRWSGTSKIRITPLPSNLPQTPDVADFRLYCHIARVVNTSATLEVFDYNHRRRYANFAKYFDVYVS